MQTISKLMKILSNLLIKSDTKDESIRNKYIEHALTVRINYHVARRHCRIESFKNCDKKFR